MKRTTLIILASLTCASAPFAVKQASAQKADTPAQVNPLDFPVGDWNCTGNVMAMGKKPGHATTGRAHSEKILDGNWIVIHYDEEQTSTNTQPYHVVQYIGYDRGKKQVVSVALDNRAPATAPEAAPVGRATRSRWMRSIPAAARSSSSATLSRETTRVS